VRNNDEFAHTVAQNLANLIDDAFRSCTFEQSGDMTLDSQEMYNDHYMSSDRGVFLRLRLGSGEAEIGIKIQAMTDTTFEQELERIELDNQEFLGSVCSECHMPIKDRRRDHKMDCSRKGLL
jgi:CYTH domain-containing protein